jgi:hypothetical protein
MASLLNYLLGARAVREPVSPLAPPPAEKPAPPPGEAAAAVETAAPTTQDVNPAPRLDVAAIAKLQETLSSQTGFNNRVSALASRTSLSPEDVMAEALRFADRHSEAFHDFIYKGNTTTKPTQGSAGTTGQVNTIIGMMFLLGILVTLIVVLGSR